MNVPRRALCVLYAVVAVVALVGTWSNNLQIVSDGFLDANVVFWRDTLATPVSRSITVDLFWLVFPVAVWMVLEARRLEMRGVWLYIVFGLVVAISVAVPLFMIHRERTLLRTEPDAGTVRAGDLVGLGVLLAVALGYTALALPRSG